MDEQSGRGQEPGTSIHAGRVRRQNRGRGRRGQRHRQISDDIRATIVDHVVNHGLTMAEAGRGYNQILGDQRLQLFKHFIKRTGM